MGKKPKYTITESAADYLAKIVEIVTKLEYGTDFKRDIELHRENRIKAIHSSLAIEGNTLSLTEVSAVIDGRIVAAKQSEVKEVLNAYEAYDKIMTFNPYSVKDFLKAHLLMTQGLVTEAGQFRSTDVGVFDRGNIVHIGARPQFVLGQIKELFDWAKKSDLHPVLKSAIMHYEIEIIHPFADGNGRMGRLWQTLVLAKWNAVFAWIPMESLMLAKRSQYYQAITEANKADDSAVFIEFTLSAVLDSIVEQAKSRNNVEYQVKHDVKHQVKHDVELTEKQFKALQALSVKALSRKEIFAAINMAVDSRAFRRHIEPLLGAGLIEMCIADKPKSRMQKYRLTESGQIMLKNLRL